MAYVNQNSGQKRAPILVATAAIHAGLVYALVTGFAGGIRHIFPDKPLIGDQIRLPPPPPSDPPRDTTKKAQTEQPSNRHVARQALDDPFKGVDVTDVPLGGGIPLGPLDQDGPLTLPTPTPQPLFPPKAARPLSTPGGWVTTDDYPSRDLREGREGVTRFRLSIGNDGLVKDCAVTASSGSTSLDEAACAKLRKRGRFAAATDGSGAAVSGSYSGTVRWKVPID